MVVKYNLLQQIQSATSFSPKISLQKFSTYIPAHTHVIKLSENWRHRPPTNHRSASALKDTPPRCTSTWSWVVFLSRRRHQRPLPLQRLTPDDCRRPDGCVDHFHTYDYTPSTHQISIWTLHKCTVRHKKGSPGKSLLFERGIKKGALENLYYLIKNQTISMKFVKFISKYQTMQENTVCTQTVRL